MRPCSFAGMVTCVKSKREREGEGEVLTAAEQSSHLHLHLRRLRAAESITRPDKAILLRLNSREQKLLRRGMAARPRARASMMTTIVLIILLILNVCESYKGSGLVPKVEKPMVDLRRLQMSAGFGSSEIPKPKIITPSRGKKNSNLEKFLMM
jgi:hypothetical protein